jgi:hypothetical protein
MLKELIQIFQIEIDIMMYNVVHTGANTQLGGLKLGSIISEYQGSLNEVVVKPPIIEAEKVIKSIKMKDKYLFLYIIEFIYL